MGILNRIHLRLTLDDQRASVLWARLSGQDLVCSQDEGVTRTYSEVPVVQGRNELVLALNQGHSIGVEGIELLISYRDGR